MDSSSLKLAFREADLPALFHAADAQSRSGRRRFLFATACMLMSGLAAASAGSVAQFEAAGAVAALFFLAGAVLAVYLYIESPEGMWYDGRAAAESVKTLAWQYAVAGGRFPWTADSAALDDELLDAFREVLNAVELAPPPRGGAHITPAMRALRATDLGSRKIVYRDDRIEEQRAWYEGKATSNLSSSARWRISMIVLQILGGVFALTAFTAGDSDLLAAVGVLTTAGAAAAAWHQTRDYATIAAAYSVTAHELSLVRERALAPLDEREWSLYVESAEQAISREHTLWHARRAGVPRLAS